MTEKQVPESKVTNKPLSETEVRKRRMTQYYRSTHLIYTCGTCGQEKAGDEFYFDVRYVNGRGVNKCKECTRAAARARRNRDRKRLLKLKLERRKEYDRLAEVEFQCPDCRLVRKGKEYPFSPTCLEGISLTRCRVCQNKLTSEKRRAFSRELRKRYVDGRSKGARDKRARDKKKREEAKLAEQSEQQTDPGSDT